jgi:membrane dipeptidase
MGLMLDQYDYMKKLVGVDHIGVGPDFVWGWGHLFNHNSEISLTFPPEALSNGAVQTVKGFEDTSKFPNLIRGFKDRGWTDAELDKVLGGNWLRVYEQVWGE